MKNSGSPEVANYRGDGGSVVGGHIGQIRCFHSSAYPLKGTSQKSSTETLPAGLVELDKLIKECGDNPKYIFKNIRQIIADPEFLIYAYGLIKSKPGNMTPHSPLPSCPEIWGNFPLTPKYEATFPFGVRGEGEATFHNPLPQRGGEWGLGKESKGVIESCLTPLPYQESEGNFPLPPLTPPFGLGKESHYKGVGNFPLTPKYEATFPLPLPLGRGGNLVRGEGEGWGKNPKATWMGGNDKETLDGVNSKYFNNLAREIGSGSFKFKPARRIDIPKAKGGTRPLSIASPRDKIVQSAMKVILEAVFESTFSKFSHGFRPGKSTHTAIYQLRGLFTEVNWFLEANISKCFDTLPQNLIIKEIKKRIDDQVFIDLIYKCFNAGFIDASFRVPAVGSPQGSIISPNFILCNILLNLLDVWLNEYSVNFNKGTRKKANPIYTKLIRNLGNKLPQERKIIRKFIHQNEVRASLGNDPNLKRMRFVRYADDFIIGISGSYQNCVEIKEDLASFLKDKLGLELSLAKTLITSSTKCKARFLGFDISITPYKKRQLVRSNRSNGITRLSAQNSRPQILAPIKKIIAKLETKGYCKNGFKGNPTRVGRLIHLSLPMIINHYLSVGRGLLNYYACADNFTVLKARISYVLKYSCALTFASKLKLYTIKKVFSKFGYDLKIHEMVNGKKKVVGEFKDEYLRDIKKGFNLKITDYNPLSIIELASVSYPRTKALFESKCSVCNSEEKLEVHHLKHLIKLNIRTSKADYMTNMMRRMNRKQILLCKSCHNKIHQGKYFGPGL